MDYILLKKLVDGLHLNKHYDSFIRDDNSIKYIVEIYMYVVNKDDSEVIYIGNRQMPSVENDYTVTKYALADYWLNGSCAQIYVLHRYDNTSNSLFDKETGIGNKLANQHLLNNIKQEVVNCLKPNFNVQILPEAYDIYTQIGLQINLWKKSINKAIKLYTIENFISDFSYVISCIQSNSLNWHKHLIKKNRFWFISLNENDKKEREAIMFDKLTDEQKCIVIIMKEWLAMIVNNSHLNASYSMHIDKVKYKLDNARFMNRDLFDSCKTNLFDHKTAIKLLLSTMYVKSSAAQIEQAYSSFMDWRNNYNKYIFG